MRSCSCKEENKKVKLFSKIMTILLWTFLLSVFGIVSVYLIQEMGWTMYLSMFLMMPIMHGIISAGTYN